MGDVVNNWTVLKHYQSGTLIDVKVNRHKGNESIDATTTEASPSAWAGIVTVAQSSSTDAEFVSACASTWPGWSASHLTGANGPDFRSAAALNP